MVVAGFVTTTGTTAAYGGVQMAESVMERIAEGILSGMTPFHAHHDPRLELDVKVLAVDVRPAGNGELGVWVELDVDEDEWAAHGDMRGFSVSVIEPPIASSTDPDLPELTIAADAYHFTDDALTAAVAEMAPYASVGASRFYQFSIVPPATVIVDLAMAFLMSLPSGVAGNALYDALKTWFLKPKDADQTRVIFRFQDGTRTVHALVETSDATILREAMHGLRGLITAAGTNYAYDDESGEWRQAGS